MGGSTRVTGCWRPWQTLVCWTRVMRRAWHHYTWLHVVDMLKWSSCSLEKVLCSTGMWTHVLQLPHTGLPLEMPPPHTHYMHSLRFKSFHKYRCTTCVITRGGESMCVRSEPTIFCSQAEMCIFCVCSDYKGWSCLHHAAAEGYTQTMDSLLLSNIKLLDKADADGVRFRVLSGAALWLVTGWRLIL